MFVRTRALVVLGIWLQNSFLNNISVWHFTRQLTLYVCRLSSGVITLLEHNEDYVITFPSTYCRWELYFGWLCFQSSVGEIQAVTKATNQ